MLIFGSVTAWEKCHHLTHCTSSSRPGKMFWPFSYFRSLGPTLQHCSSVRWQLNCEVTTCINEPCSPPVYHFFRTLLITADHWQGLRFDDALSITPCKNLCNIWLVYKTMEHILTWTYCCILYCNILMIFRGRRRMRTHL